MSLDLMAWKLNLLNFSIKFMRLFVRKEFVIIGCPESVFLSLKESVIDFSLPMLQEGINCILPVNQSSNLLDWSLAGTIQFPFFFPCASRLHLFEEGGTLADIHLLPVQTLKGGWWLLGEEGRGLLIFVHLWALLRKSCWDRVVSPD